MYNKIGGYVKPKNDFISMYSLYWGIGINCKKRTMQNVMKFQRDDFCVMATINFEFYIVKFLLIFYGARQTIEKFVNL